MAAVSASSYGLVLGPLGHPLRVLASGAPRAVGRVCVCVRVYVCVCACVYACACVNT